MTPYFKKLLPCIIIILIHVIFILIPSVDFLPYFNPTVSGKFITFLFLIEVATFLYFTRQLLNSNSLTISLVDILFTGIVVYITLNRYVFQSNYSFSIRYYELLGLFTLYLILSSSKTEKIFYSICLTAIVGADIQIIIGNLQLYGLVHSNNSFLKTSGSFFNSGPYAGYLASVFPVSLFFFKKNNAEIFGSKIGKLVKVIVLFNIIGTFSIVPVLMSRACFVSILFTIIIVYYKEISSFCRNLIKRKAIKFLFYLILTGCVVAGPIFLVSLKTESSKGRYLILKTTAGMVTDKPIFGFGFDRFRSNYMNYQAGYLKNHSDKNEATNADNTVYAFNEPLQFVVENGIVGFLLLVIFLYFLIKNTDKKNELVRLALIGLFAIFIFSLFSYPSEILPIKIIVFLYLSILASYYRGDYGIELNLEKVRINSLIKNIVIWPLLLVGTVLFYLIFTQTLKIEQAFFEWGQADLKYNEKDFSSSKVAYESSYPILEKNGDFLTNYGEIIFFLKDYKKGIEVLKQAKLYTDNTVLETTLGNCQRALKDYKDAERSYIAASDMKPSSYFNKFLLFKLYEEDAQTSKAITTAQELLKLRIKVQSEAVDAMRNEAKFFLSQHR